jgi:proline iminopeptidase
VFPEEIERQGGIDVLDTLGDSTAAKRNLREYFRMLFVSTAKRDEFLAGFDSYQYNPAVNALLDKELGGLDLWPALPALRMPTLVMTGRYDMNVAPSTAWKIHKAIPGSRWEVFEKSGHLPYFEEPERFVSVLEGFLGAP